MFVSGFTCGVESTICRGMSWEQKSITCLYALGIWAGIASEINEADLTNLATLPGKAANNALD